MDYPLPRKSKCAIKFHFEKGALFLKIMVLDNDQSQVRNMINPRREVKVEEWVVNRQQEKQKIKEEQKLPRTKTQKRRLQ